MKANQKQRLSAYSCSAIALIAGQSLNGQVIYHDIDPDVTLEAFGDGSGGGWLSLDIDGDGSTDIRTGVNDFFDSYTSGGSFFIGSSVHGDIWNVNPNFEVIGTSINSIVVWSMPYRSWDGPASILDSGFEIGPDADWIHDHDALLYVSHYNPEWWHPYTQRYGEWGGPMNTHKYIGFRKVTGGDYQYGWIRLSTEFTPKTDGVFGSSYYKVMVHDYAFNVTMNDPLFAGEGIPACESPDPIGTLNITATSAKAKWDPVADAEKYKLWYRQVGVVAWTKKTVIPTEKKLKSLLCNTSYEWKVKAVCADGSSEFSAVQTFTTDACRMDGEDEFIADEINVFPNPANDQITIEFVEFDSEQAGLVTILDLSGRVVAEINLYAESLIVNISEFAAGIYQIRINYDDRIVTGKFIKL